jgi:hypothetical protein
MVSHGAALRSLWTDKFSLIKYREVTDSGGATGFEEDTAFENEPCKLSFSTLAAGSDDDMTVGIAQITKLFCDKSLNILPDSKIRVTRDGRVFEYGLSGEPGVFSNHQEILLTPYRSNA